MCQESFLSFISRFLFDFYLTIQTLNGLDLGLYSAAFYSSFQNWHSTSKRKKTKKTKNTQQPNKKPQHRTSWQRFILNYSFCTHQYIF